jgi:hypothetical protein
MAVPLFVLHNERTRTFKKRSVLEKMSDFEVRKHTGLTWEGASELIEWLEPNLSPIYNRNNALSAETKILISLGFLRSGSFQWMMGTASGSSQATASRVIEQVGSMEAIYIIQLFVL